MPQLIYLAVLVVFEVSFRVRIYLRVALGGEQALETLAMLDNAKHVEILSEDT